MNNETTGLIDLHIHSSYSDGALGMEELIHQIRRSGVKTFSVTDHDTIKNYKEIFKMKLTDLDYIRGVEISSRFNNYNMHILGYDFNDYNFEMNNLVENIKQLRRNRIFDLIKIISEKYNINFKPEDLKRLYGKDRIIGKPHIIEILYKYGCGISNEEIYNKYFKNNKSKINYRASFEDTINSIKNANGIAVLAHPKEVEDEYHIDIETIIKDLIDGGLDGIEVYNSIHNLKDIKKYLDLAKKYNLLISGGSDYHGQFTKNGVEIGNVSKEKLNIKTLSLVNYIKKRE